MTITEALVLMMIGERHQVEKYISENEWRSYWKNGIGEMDLELCIESAWARSVGVTVIHEENSTELRGRLYMSREGLMLGRCRTDAFEGGK